MKDGEEREITDILFLEGEPAGSVTIRYFNEENKGFGYISDEIQRGSL